MTAHYASASQTMASDAGYQAILTSWHTALTNAGLVQTADTGQVNHLTATRPAINVANDYMVFRFDDSLQATAPIFVKMIFGSGAALGRLNVAVTVGTGSDGAGNITSPNRSVQTGVNPTSTNSDIGAQFPGLRDTFACHTEGFFGISWHNLEATAAFAGFLIARTVDVAGVPTAEGFLFQTRNAGGTNTPGGFTSTFAYGTPTQEISAVNHVPCLPVGFLGSTFVGLDRQVYLTWGAYPRAKAHNQMFTYRTTELTYLTPVEVTLFGAQRTYMPMGYYSVGWSDAIGSTSFGTAMLWE